MRDVNFNFSDDLEKLELVIKDTAYTYEHNYSRRSRRTAGRPRPPPCSSRCPLLAVGLSADTAKEGKNAHGSASSSGIRASDFGSFSGCSCCSALCIKMDDDADLWDERRILS